MAKVTAKEVERIVEVGRHAVGDNLYLEVDDRQRKRWVFRYQLNGKRSTMGLGGYDSKANGLAAARKRCLELRQLIAQGVDPVSYGKEQKLKDAEQRARQSSDKEAASYTLEVCAQEWIARRTPEWSNPKHQQQVANTLRDYVYPTIGSMPVDSITMEHIRRCLDPIWESKTETANRVRQRLEGVFSYAIVMGKRTQQNPAQWKGYLDQIYAAPEKVKQKRRLASGDDGHFAAMPYKDLPNFMGLLKSQRGIAALALRFTILTASRTGSVRLLTWDQLDLDNRVWTVPAANMKGRKEFRVALSSHACELLESIPQLGDYVFMVSRVGKPLSENTMLALLKRMDRQDVTVHGFRSSFRDYVGEETEFSERLAEHALAHTIKSATERAYARGDQLDRRYALMEHWGKYLMGELHD